MDRIVYDFFFVGGGSGQFFLFSFRFRIQGTLTTDPWPRANPLDASYKFCELLPMQLGQIPYNKTERTSVGQCYPEAYERVAISHQVYERVGKSII